VSKEGPGVTSGAGESQGAAAQFALGCITVFHAAAALREDLLPSLQEPSATPNPAPAYPTRSIVRATRCRIQLDASRLDCTGPGSRGVSMCASGPIRRVGWTSGT